MTELPPKFDLRRLPFSPVENPLVEGRFTMRARNKQVRTGQLAEITDPHTGEIKRAAIIEEIELDESQFVKVFADGIRAAFGLSLTGSRVFQAVLRVYQASPMTGGFVDCIYLHFFDGGLSGVAVDIEDRTFRRGLKELLEKGFLYPRGENLFWVNPSLFFKGDRATFIKHYRRRRSTDEEVKRAELEAAGQLRLDVP
jgi:hypothetical protein